MRASLAALALIALAAGCGSSTSSSKRGAPKPGTLEALWRGSGQSVSLIPGTSDYSAGELRVSFLVVDPRGRVIAPPQARVWIARSLQARPFSQALARLEPIGVPGVSTGADVKALYVAHVRVDEPGIYYLLARPLRARIGAVHELLVRSRAASPAIGSRAFPSRTPTLCRTSASSAVKGGDHVSKARLIYLAVFAILIVTALLPALAVIIDGPHEGGEI